MPESESQPFEEFLQTLPGVGVSTARKVADLYDGPSEVAGLTPDELKESAGISLAQATSVVTGLTEAQAPAPTAQIEAARTDELLSAEEVATAQRFKSEGRDYVKSLATIRAERIAKQRRKLAQRSADPGHMLIRVQIDPFSAITRRIPITPALCTICGFDYCSANRLPAYDELDPNDQTRVKAGVKKHVELNHADGMEPLPVTRVQLMSA